MLVYSYHFFKLSNNHDNYMVGGNMVDGNIVDCNMYGHVQNKQKETCIGFKKTRIGSIIISIFTASMLLPCVPSSFQING